MSSDRPAAPTPRLLPMRRRALMIGTGQLAAAALLLPGCGVSPGIASSPAGAPPAPWDDGTLWDDGTGWAS